MSHVPVGSTSRPLYRLTVIGLRLIWGEIIVIIIIIIVVVVVVIDAEKLFSFEQNTKLRFGMF